MMSMVNNFLFASASKVSKYAYGFRLKALKKNRNENKRNEKQKIETIMCL